MSEAGEGQSHITKAGIIQKAADKGITTHKSFRSRFLRDLNSGVKVIDKIQASELLEKDDPYKKDAFYFRIAQRGLGIRTHQKHPNSHKFTSTKFTENLAADLGLVDQPLRKMLRAMRADMVYSELEAPDSKLQQEFASIARDFIESYTSTLGTAQPSTAILTLKEQWQSDSIPEFYRILYQVFKHRGLGTWAPYEIEAMKLFYEDRVQNKKSLTAFDRLILEGRKMSKSPQEIMDLVRTTTGVLVNAGVIDQHRRALIHGNTL